MIITDINQVNEYLASNDAVLINESDYRVAFAFAIGCMGHVHRDTFMNHMTVDQLDIPSGDDIVLVRGQLTSAIAFIKEVLDEGEYQFLKDHYNFELYDVIAV